MPNTYSQIYIHSIIAVQNKISLIQPEWKNELFQCITEIVQTNGHKLIAINGMPDHVHLFSSLKPIQSLSSFIQDVKAETLKMIQQRELVNGRFEWQGGFGAFSYSHSHIENVIKYIQNQETFHTKKTFIQEYSELLEKFNVPFDERYIFKAVEY